MDSSQTPRYAVVIDDDSDIRQLLVDVLTQAGFQAIPTGNGLDGLAAVRRFDPIVTTLDVNMPGMDGFETAKRIREFSSTYIVMLTALEEEIDTLQGLDSGADDYLVKPFRPRVLRARIEAMLRRPRSVPTDTAVAETTQATPPPPAYSAPAQPPQAPPAQPAYSAPPQSAYAIQPPLPIGAIDAVPVAEAPAAPSYAPPVTAPVVEAVTAPAQAPPAAPPVSYNEGGWISHNGLWLNVETRVVRRDNAEVDLTRSEFDLLAAILQSNRRVRTKPDLALLLRGESYVTSHLISESDKRAIEVHMANLRKKLADNVNQPRWIETVRGVGYRLTAPENS